VCISSKYTETTTGVTASDESEASTWLLTIITKNPKRRKNTACIKLAEAQVPASIIPVEVTGVIAYKDTQSGYDKHCSIAKLLKVMG